MKSGYLRGLSIGYRTVKASHDAQRNRHLMEVQLLEVSPVTFPANDLAQVDEVKSRRSAASAEAAFELLMLDITVQCALWELMR